MPEEENDVLSESNLMLFTVGDQETDTVANVEYAKTYDLNASLMLLSDNCSYPGVYSVKLLSEDSAAGTPKEIGIPSISKEELKERPTTESPAIIMGAAVPYEKKTGPTEYEKLTPDSRLYAPYSYFRYEIIEEPNLNGEGIHKKMSGYDGTYVIIRVDVDDLIKDAEDGSYLHVRQTNNKALMVKIGQDVTYGAASFSDAGGSKTGSYLISENKLVKRDEDGGYREISWIDVILLSSGTLVQGADTGSKPEKKGAPLADFPLSFYIDKVGDYDPGIEWNTSLGTAVNKSDGKPITLSEDDIRRGITTSDKVLEKYYRDDKADAAPLSSNYVVMGSDIELEIQVGDNQFPNENEYWSLKNGMESPTFTTKPDSKALKLICEVPLLNQISVNGIENNEQGTVYPDAAINNTGDIVLVPGYLINAAHMNNRESGNIIMAAVDEIIIPITPFADKPLITEQRIDLGYDEYSWFINIEGAIIVTAEQ